MHAEPQPQLLTGRGRRCLALAAALVAAAGCDLTSTAVGGVEGPGTNRLTVSVRNVGNGLGGVDIGFPAGTTVQNPCPAVLGSGESCSPFVLLFDLPSSVSVEARAEAGSEFVAWADAECAAAGNECTVAIDTAADEPVIALEPRFDLVGGG
ncbi:MAG: hypothetical protein R3266_09110 [Gemmatimonadota bacterium]|nr:hypothetical protein [Gemmatimonadota bacterium]